MTRIRRLLFSLRPLNLLVSATAYLPGRRQWSKLLLDPLWLRNISPVGLLAWCSCKFRYGWKITLVIDLNIAFLLLTICKFEVAGSLSVLHVILVFDNKHVAACERLLWHPSLGYADYRNHLDNAIATYTVHVFYRYQRCPYNNSRLRWSACRHRLGLHRAWSLRRLASHQTNQSIPWFLNQF